MPEAGGRGSHRQQQETASPRPQGPVASGGGDRAQSISKFSGNDPLAQFQFLAGPLPAPAPGREPAQGGQEGAPDTGEAGGAAAGSAISVTCPGGRAPESPRRRARVLS